VRLYFDTPYVAKCYLNEAGGEAVRSLARGASELCSSALVIAELSCVFLRHVRDGSLTRAMAGRLRQYFLKDLEDEVWSLVPVSEATLRRIEVSTRSLPRTVYLRAGDAIHLVSALEAGFDEIWTNDRHLLAAAPHLGIRGRTVE